MEWNTTRSKSKGPKMLPLEWISKRVKKPHKKSTYCKTLFTYNSRLKSSDRKQMSGWLRQGTGRSKGTGSLRGSRHDSAMTGDGFYPASPTGRISESVLEWSEYCFKLRKIKLTEKARLFQTWCLRYTSGASLVLYTPKVGRCEMAMQELDCCAVGPEAPASLKPWMENETPLHCNTCLLQPHLPICSGTDRVGR